MSVTVYSKPSCVACTATYRALDNKGIEYDVIDVTTNEDALEFIKGLGYQAAPVVVTEDGQHWSQFRAEKIAALQNIA